MSTLHKVLLCVAALCLAAALLPRFDGSPPELSWAEPPPEVVAGDAELAVLASDRRPGIRAVEASLDGSPLQVDEVGGGRWLVHIRSGGLEDGPHSLEVVAIDRSFRRHRSVLRHEVLTDNSPPQVQVARSSRRAAQEAPRS